MEIFGPGGPKHAGPFDGPDAKIREFLIEAAAMGKTRDYPFKGAVAPWNPLSDNPLQSRQPPLILKDPITGELGGLTREFAKWLTLWCFHWTTSHKWYDIPLEPWLRHGQCPDIIPGHPIDSQTQQQLWELMEPGMWGTFTEVPDTVLKDMGVTGQLEDIKTAMLNQADLSSDDAMGILTQMLFNTEATWFYLLARRGIGDLSWRNAIRSSADDARNADAEDALRGITKGFAMAGPEASRRKERRDKDRRRRKDKKEKEGYEDTSIPRHLGGALRRRGPMLPPPGTLRRVPRPAPRRSSARPLPRKLRRRGRILLLGPRLSRLRNAPRKRRLGSRPPACRAAHRRRLPRLPPLALRRLRRLRPLSNRNWIYVQLRIAIMQFQQTLQKAGSPHTTVLAGYPLSLRILLSHSPVFGASASGRKSLTLLVY
jgi:hypothetical protein